MDAIASTHPTPVSQQLHLTGPGACTLGCVQLELCASACLENAPTTLFGSKDSNGHGKLAPRFRRLDGSPSLLPVYFDPYIRPANARATQSTPTQ